MEKIQTNFLTLPDCYSIALLSANVTLFVVTWLDRINHWCTVVGLMLVGGKKINKPLQKRKNITEFHDQHAGDESQIDHHTIVKVLHTTNSRHSGGCYGFRVNPSNKYLPWLFGRLQHCFIERMCLRFVPESSMVLLCSSSASCDKFIALLLVYPADVQYMELIFTLLPIHCLLNAQHCAWQLRCCRICSLTESKVYTQMAADYLTGLKYHMSDCLRPPNCFNCNSNMATVYRTLRIYPAETNEFVTQEVMYFDDVSGYH